MNYWLFDEREMQCLPEQEICPFCGEVANTESEVCCSIQAHEEWEMENNNPLLDEEHILRLLPFAQLSEHTEFDWGDLPEFDGADPEAA
jgi:hypothetical protein